MRKLVPILFLLVVVALLPGLAMAQGEAPKHPPPPPDGFIPISVLYWVVGIATPAIGAMWAVALSLTKRIWARLETVQGEHEDERKGWQEEKEGLAETHAESLDELRESVTDEKRAMRETFEAEKNKMRDIYTGEIGTLRDRLETEQRERREESEKLLRENNLTTREVMEVAQLMTKSMDNNTRVVAEWVQEAKK